MTEVGRRQDIEQELKKLGWTNKDWNCHEIHVYLEYKPKKNNGKIWEIVVFGKIPVWQYDFVEYGQNDYLDYSPERGGFIWNERLDFEFESVENAYQTAIEIDRQRKEELEWCMNNPFPFEFVWPWKWPVQRVEDRPNG